MNHHKIGKWRRVFGLSATFLLCFLVSVACKKKTSDIGIGSLDQNELLAGGGIDTFSLTTFTKLDDSVVTKNAALATLGSYHDPVFGKVNASIYTQIRLISSNPVFGDLSDIIMDSLILTMRYSGFTGASDDQTFEVFELDDTISGSSSVNYFMNSTIALKSQDLVDPNYKTQKMNPSKEVVIGSVLSTPQLRIRLDTMLAKKFMSDALSNPSDFASADGFAKYFKGLCVRVNNGSQPPGKGGIGYFSLTDDVSKLVMYYRVKQQSSSTYLSQEYSFRINSNAQRFNHMDIDRAGTKVQEVLNNPNKGQEEFYAQAFGARGVVRLPTITNLPKSTIIHRAELFLPVQQGLLSPYNLGNEITLAAKLSEEGLSLLNFGVYNDFRKGFVIDVRNLVQQVVSGRLENTDLFVAPKNFITSADRIIFNGTQTSNKLQPKLTLIYSEF